MYIQNRCNFKKHCNPQLVESLDMEGLTLLLYTCCCFKRIVFVAYDSSVPQAGLDISKKVWKEQEVLRMHKFPVPLRHLFCGSKHK